MDTQPELTPEQQRERKLASWEATKQQLATLKDLEMAQRKECTALYFPEPKQGTQRVELGNDYKLKLVAKQNYTLDKDNSKVDKVQDAIEATGNEGVFIAERLFKWSVELSVSEYKDLCEQAEKGSAQAIKIKALVDTILTTSWGAPTLEIEAPKVKK